MKAYFNRSFIFCTFLFAIAVSVFSQENPVKVTCHKNKQNGYDFNYEKNEEGSYLVIMKLNNAVNAPGSIFKQVVKASSGLLVSVNPVNKTCTVLFSTFDTYCFRGVPDPKIDNSFVYALPYKKGNSVEVNFLTNLQQTIGNRVTNNFRAFEFSSNKSDTACAVRKGVVVSVVDRYEMDTTLGKSFTSIVNSILVEQGDGTLAYYSGFRKGSIFVKEGQTVLPYMPLGRLNYYESRKTFNLRFMVYFLSDGNEANRTVGIETKNYNIYMDPWFLTDLGVIKLMNHKPYRSAFMEDVLKREMSKKELNAIGRRAGRYSY